MISTRLIALVSLLLGFTLLLDSTAIAKAKSKPKPTNKLLHMYRLYYLPFSIYFREGSSINEIVPFVDNDANGLTKRILKAQDLQTLNNEWDEIRKHWRKRSLFLSTPVSINKSVRISRSLVSHKIPLSRRAFDGVSLSDRIKITEKLKSQSPKVKKAFRQLRFLKSFVKNDNKYHFFIISASWCQSCLEYRALLEAYVKKFPNSKLVLHSIVVDDTKEEIFDSKILKEMFPHPKKYSHESIPRFLSLEKIKGNLVVKEEGDALKTFHNRFLKKHRGYLDAKSSIFNKKGERTPKRQLSSTSK